MNAIFEAKCVGEYDPIVEVEILNPEITKSSISAKSSVMDIRAKTSKGEIIDIEMQRKDDDSTINRMVYYSSKLMSKQLKQGKRYRAISRSVAIVITNFNVKGITESHFHNVYRYKNIVTNDELTNLQELHFIELPKMKDCDENDVLQLFLQFLKKPNDEKVIKNQMKLRNYPKLEKC